jgi:3-oxoacyl-[acyl-carrier-protein] synthase-3
MSACVPDTREDLEVLYQKGVISSSNFSKLRDMGIESFQVDSQCTIYDLLFKTLDPIFIDNCIDPSSIKKIILAHRYRSFPNTINIVDLIRQRYGLDSAIGYSVGDLECGIYLQALHMAVKFLLNENPNHRILLVCVEKALEDVDRSGDDNFVMGDSGTAAIIGYSIESGDDIVSIVSEVDTRKINLGFHRSERGFDFDFSIIVTLAKVLKRCLSDAGITLNDIRLWLPSNGSLESFKRLATLLHIPESIVFTNGLPQFGHSGNGDLILNYCMAVESGYLKKDDFYVLGSIGLGGVVGCAICRRR